MLVSKLLNVQSWVSRRVRHVFLFVEGILRFSYILVEKAYCNLAWIYSREKDITIHHASPSTTAYRKA